VGVVRGTGLEPSVPLLRKGLLAVAERRYRTDKLDGVIKHSSSRETTVVGRGPPLHGRLFDGGTDGSNPVPSSGESSANLTFDPWRWDGSGRRWRHAPAIATRQLLTSDNPSCFDYRCGIPTHPAIYLPLTPRLALWTNNQARNIPPQRAEDIPPARGTAHELPPLRCRSPQ